MADVRDTIGRLISPGTQFGYGGLGTAMYAHERATPMRYTHLVMRLVEIV